MSTLWWLLCGGYFVVASLGVYSVGVYSVVATLWWLLWVSTLGVYSGCLLCVLTLQSTLGAYSVASTLWWLLCGG